MFWSLLYNALLVAAAVVAVPWYGARMALTGKYRRSLGPKLGLPRPPLDLPLHGGPRIWVHAVSVGEVTAAVPIVTALRTRLPDAFIVVSTSTETGQEMARKLATDASALIYYPLDLPGVVRRMLDRVRPDCFVPVETELWPNFIRLCRARGTRVVMVNGRISPRSFGRYRATRLFWRGTLAAIDQAGVISQTDGERLLALGMGGDRIRVVGNAKYDGLAARVSPTLAREIADRLGIGPGEEVLVAGSTHDGEEAVVLEVYRRLLETRPDFRLILVPRHVERGDAVAALAGRAGFPDLLRMTEIRAGRRRDGERVILIDTIGELFKAYSLATVVFCGGSLVPKGGQNLLEAAAWGKVVLHGPHMEDFREERRLLGEAGAGICVRDGAEMLAAIRRLLDDRDRLRAAGLAGRLLVEKNRGAADRYAELVSGVLERARLSPPPASGTRPTSGPPTAGTPPSAPG